MKSGTPGKEIKQVFRQFIGVLKYYFNRNVQG